jgi:outer membrane receptor protein involved in Fe transport
MPCKLHHSAFILLTALFFFASSVQAQQTTGDKITVSLAGENLTDAIKKIEKHTQYKFFYRNTDIDSVTNLHISLTAGSIDELLHEILKNTTLSYRLMDNSILIEKTPVQTRYTLKGRVIGADYKGVEFATINMFRTGNEAVIQTTLADSSGYFELTTSEKGNYLLQITAVGRDSITMSIAIGDKSVMELPDLMLLPNTKKLSAVTVVSKKPFIEQKIDRTVVNVGALISNTGTNALEVLQKSPGVLVDESGKITFKGKSGVLVLIDDKPTYMSGDNLANYLRSLPSSMLDQIELMSNPPAKYDAEGNAGVINIKTKRTKTRGFNGTATASYGQGYYPQTNESLNLNYRNGKVNVFANLGFTAQRTYRKLDLERNYFDSSTNKLQKRYRETSYFKPLSYNYNVKAGMDYYQSPKTTIGVIFTGTYINSTTRNPSTGEMFDGQERFDSSIHAVNRTKRNFTSKGINLNYSHQFDSLGKVLTFDLDYVKYDATLKQSFFNQTVDPYATVLAEQTIDGYIPTDIDIYAAKADYTSPLKNKGTLSAGIKSSYVSTDNAANYSQWVNNVNFEDTINSNHFLYRENINAAYINYNHDFKRFSLQLGLRGENTYVKGHQLGNSVQADSQFTQRYTKFFPTAYVSYKLNKTGEQLLNFAYGRRIGRPYYQDLNPFITILNKYTYLVGNTFLKPQYTDNFELAYNYNNMLTVTLMYNNTRDYQVETIQQDGPIFVSRTMNLGKREYKGISVSNNFKVTKWWDCNLYGEVTNYAFKSPLYNTYLDANKTYVYFNVTNQFTFPKGWNAEVSGYYVSSRISGQFIQIPTGQLNAGIQKKMLKGRGTIKLAIRDILRTNFGGGKIISIPNATSTFRNDFANRVVVASFAYNFGKSFQSPKKRKTGSSDTERNRVKE